MNTILHVQMHLVVQDSLAKAHWQKLKPWSTCCRHHKMTQTFSTATKHVLGENRPFCSLLTLPGQVGANAWSGGAGACCQRGETTGAVEVLSSAMEGGEGEGAAIRRAWCFQVGEYTQAHFTMCVREVCQHHGEAAVAGSPLPVAGGP